jgi:hypothetical protein
LNSLLVLGTGDEVRDSRVSAGHDPGRETVLPSFNVVNRDPAAFADPDRLDVGRSPRSTWVSVRAPFHGEHGSEGTGELAQCQ